MTPEGRVKNMVRKALDQLGPDCWRFMPVQSGYGAPALDFLLSVRGRFVAIETKAPGKKLTAQQEITKAKIEAAGGLVFVVWDEITLTAAMEIINGFPDRVRTFTSGQSSPASQRADVEHEGAIEPAQAADEAAGGDHGAPAEPPKRRAKPQARRHDQRVTAAVKKGSTDGNS